MQYGKKYHIEVNAQAAGAVIFNSKKQVLLVQELVGKKKGLWHIPSGSVESNELPQAAAIREIEEETGLTLVLTNYLNTYVGCFDDGDLVLRHVWWTQYQGGQIISPNFTHEIGKTHFFTKEEVQDLYDKNKLRMHHTLLMIQDAFTALENELSS